MADLHERNTNPQQGQVEQNALCESFFAPLECELIIRRSFRTRKEAQLAIFSYIT